MGGFNFGVDQLKQDDYLTQLAQSVAELNGDQHGFINSYNKDTNLNVLVFGIKLNGKTTYKQILTEDFNSKIIYLIFVSFQHLIINIYFI